MTTATEHLKARWTRAIDAFEPTRVGGRVVSSRGLMLTCRMPAAVNDRCEILTGHGGSCLAVRRRRSLLGDGCR